MLFKKLSKCYLNSLNRFSQSANSARIIVRYQHAQNMLVKEHDKTSETKEYESDYDLPKLFPEQLSLAVKPKIQELLPETVETVNAVHTLKALSPGAVEENVALLDAHLKVGNVQLASRMFFQLWRRNPGTMARLTNVGLVNRFIEVCVLKTDPLITEAETFFNSFDELSLKANNLNRNLETYSHMAYGYVRQNDSKSLEQLLAKLQMELLELPKQLILFTADLYPERILDFANKVKSLGHDTPSTDELKNIIKQSQNLDTSSVAAKIEASKALNSDQMLQNAERSDKMLPSDILGVQSPGVDALRNALLVMANGQASLYEQQQQLEEEGYKLAVEELETLKKDSKSLGPMTIPKQLVLQWHELLVKEIDERRSRAGVTKTSNVEARKSGHVLSKDGCASDIDHAHVFLSLLDSPKASLITITELLRQHTVTTSTTDVRTAPLFKIIGSSLEKEYQTDMLKLRRKEKFKSERKKMETWMLMNTGNNALDPELRQYATNVEREMEKDKGNWVPRWPDTVKVKIGAMLCDMAISVCLMPGTEEPAFRHETAIIKAKKYGVVRYHMTLTQILSREPLRESLTPRMLPMLVAPRPWLTWTSGGYLESRIECVRIRQNKEHKAFLKEADERGHLTLVLQALDVLGKTAWRVNEKVFPVVKAIWNSGEAFSDIPGVEKLPPPEKPDNLESDPEVARRYWKSYYDWSHQVQALYSQRCDANYKVEIASSFLGKTMYFPHNVDFRGRAYPMPPHLNHIGNDLCRGLMLFDEARVIGEKGLWWLYVQVANLYGADKIKFDERVAFVRENIEMVFDSARRPLEGKKWWQEAASPWQCLAACMELEAALQLPDPHMYESRLPIHQDGTCNGLQHYAALGGDIKGAAQVNLVPSGAPQDVYSGVANVVRQRVAEDVKLGKPEAIKVQNLITRKLVKQTVMTNTYGVTMIGAKAQVFHRLREIRQDLLLKKLPMDDWMQKDDEMKRVAAYVTQHTFAALGELFTGAREIQNWLNTAASMISKSFTLNELSETELEISDFLEKIGVFSPKNTSPVEGNSELSFVGLPDTEAESDSINDEDWLVDEILDSKHGTSVDEELSEEEELSDIKSRKRGVPFKKDRMASVTWTTPLGMPIIQPYRLQYVKTVQTSLQTVNVLDPTLLGPVNSRKQSTAFPPNFIHSLDASHMMLSAITCQRHGLTFAAVHDSYWTHACDVDRMSEILRECFIKLHSDNIMQRLLTEFQLRYSENRHLTTVELTPEQAAAFAQEAKKRKWRLGNRLWSSKKTKGDTSSPNKLVHAYTRLCFPPLPKRGEFDVSLVKSSSYFFH